MAIIKELDETYFDEIKELFRSVFMAPPWNDDWSDENQLNEYLLDLMRVRTPLVLGLYDEAEGTDEDSCIIDNKQADKIQPDKKQLDKKYFGNKELVGISIGNIKHWWGGTEYHIEELCIKTDRQGEGLGSQFFDLIEEYLKKRDISQIFLMTEKRVPAYEFYKNRGFEEIEGQVSFFLDFRKPVIRPMKKSEYHLLDDFLYEAIFIPEGVDAPPKSIIQDDALQVYIKDFGDKPDDRCLAAVADGKVVGAVWTRIMNDYGHIDDSTPSFAISLYEEYRGKGIGTELMVWMIKELKSAGYEKCSLAVQKENYAVKLYKNTGFEIVDENEEEYIMVRRLQK